MLYCPNFFWNVLQVWMTGKDVYLQMTWSWPDKTWNILCSYCLQWNTSQSKFRNHYFLFLFAFSILSQLFLIWGCRNKVKIGKINIMTCVNQKQHRIIIFQRFSKVSLIEITTPPPPPPHTHTLCTSSHFPARFTSSLLQHAFTGLGQFHWNWMLVSHDFITCKYDLICNRTGKRGGIFY